MSYGLAIWFKNHALAGHCQNCCDKEENHNFRMNACFGGYPENCPYEKKKVKT